MSKSIIYAGSNSTVTTAATGTIIPFSNIVRRYGCNCNTSGGNVVCTGQGYYSGSVNVTLNGTAAGNATVQVLANGTAIPYAYGSCVTSATSTNTITIPFVVRNNCNCVDTTITVEVGGVIADVVNAAIAVEKE